MPGSVHSPAAAGTNALLAAGCPPCRDASDVLVALGLAGAAPSRRTAELQPDGDAGRVLAAVGWEPTTLEQLCERLDVAPGPLSVHLAALERDGWIAVGAGWVERLR